MNRKFIVAILLVAAVPAFARAQKPSAAKVTKADAQNVLKTISGDKAKTQTYCDMTKLGEQIEQANEKKTTKWSMSCRRNWWHWKKNWVPNITH